MNAAQDDRGVEFKPADDSNDAGGLRAGCDSVRRASRERNHGDHVSDCHHVDVIVTVQGPRAMLASKACSPVPSVGANAAQISRVRDAAELTTASVSALAASDGVRIRSGGLPAAAELVCGATPSDLRHSSFAVVDCGEYTAIAEKDISCPPEQKKCSAIHFDWC